MPDSPKCLNCLKAGQNGQTYKVAGKDEYKCSSCKHTYIGRDFEPEAFTWRDDQERWKKWLESKGIQWGARYVA